MVLIYIPCKKLALSENAGKRLTNGKRLGKAAAALDKCTTNTTCGRPVHGADEYGSDRIGWRYGGQWVEAQSQPQIPTLQPTSFGREAFECASSSHFGFAVKKVSQSTLVYKAGVFGIFRVYQ